MFSRVPFGTPVGVAGLGVNCRKAKHSLGRARALFRQRMVLRGDVLAGNMGSLPIGITSYPKRKENDQPNVIHWVGRISSIVRVPIGGEIAFIRRECPRASQL